MKTCMKQLSVCFVMLTCTVTLFGCTKMRYAQTSIGQALTTPVKQNAQGIPVEVICNEGTVCAEVEVLSVNVEQHDAGAVQVLLHNRTGKSVLVQVGLWVLSPQGALLDETPFESVPLEPRQERMWQAQGVYRQNAKLQVRLRAATPRF
ncbi:MAG: hypothetical protein AAF320_06380 [Myxococcota bacterium]